MKPTLRPGLSHSAEWTVTAKMAPPHLDVEVLSTPWLLGLVEQASLDAVREHLEDHETLVGTGMVIRHDAPVMAGEVVTVVSTLTAVGRRLAFDGVVSCERGRVGTVSLQSAVVDTRRFAH